MTYTGKAYKTKSGQWAWRISDEQGELCGGGGYASEESAEQAMNDELATYQQRGEQ
uniref:DUF1508 domain-containing protein n=1 Tax=uncultured prokaryote TaxID=198431 RepID=A0A0H5QL32_9ZZZZ|nr:hypothetical protein [uncultured prokaryote]